MKKYTIKYCFHGSFIEVECDDFELSKVNSNNITQIPIVKDEGVEKDFQIQVSEVLSWQVTENSYYPDSYIEACKNIVLENCRKIHGKIDKIKFKEGSFTPSDSFNSDEEPKDRSKKQREFYMDGIHRMIKDLQKYSAKPRELNKEDEETLNDMLDIHEGLSWAKKEIVHMGELSKYSNNELEFLEKTLQTQRCVNEMTGAVDRSISDYLSEEANRSKKLADDLEKHSVAAPMRKPTKEEKHFDYVTSGSNEFDITQKDISDLIYINSNIVYFKEKESYNRLLKIIEKLEMNQPLPLKKRDTTSVKGDIKPGEDLPFKKVKDRKQIEKHLKIAYESMENIKSLLKSSGFKL